MNWPSKLGFWNRLALVVAVLFTLAWPTLRIMSINSEKHDARLKAYELCIDTAPPTVVSNSVITCGEIWLKNGEYLGWAEWFISVGISALAAAIAYGLIWSAVAIVRWVWRGRTPGS